MPYFAVCVSITLVIKRLFGKYKRKQSKENNESAKKAEEGKTYPCCIFSHGAAPDQFSADLNPTNMSIFDEAMDDFAEFEGDDYYDDPM